MTVLARDELIETTLNGRYRINAEIGAGGMSTVYLAFDETLERPVAVKVLHSEISSDPSALERFRREARTVAQLSHPNVVIVIDAGEDEGRPFIVFEHIKGETLKERIRRVGPLPVSEAVAFAIEIGRALQAAHERQLVHRDVKPHNVLIDEEGRAKVTDFGIARNLELEARHLTGAGRVVGTTDYVSPEQALGHEVTGQSDVYSLGIVLYEMLSGEVPFKGDNSMDVAIKHVREGLPDVQKRRPQISAALAAVVERATAKEATNRYASASEMVRDLEEVLAYEAARAGDAEAGVTAVLDRIPGRMTRRGSWRRLLGYGVPALVILGLAVAAGLVIDNARNDKPAPTAPAELQPIHLAENDVLDYDPPPGGGEENRALAPLALDRDPTTAWTTERYQTADFSNIKDGVGLYLDVGRPVIARALRVVSPVKGWTLDLYVSNDPVPKTVADWTRVGTGALDANRKTFNLDTGAQRFRYYLVWVTKLPVAEDGGFRASISELALLG